MKELTLSTGYQMIKNVIGEKYADVVYDIACCNVRHKIYFPIYVHGSCGRLKKALPMDVLKKLSQHFGSQALYLHKENLTIDTSKRRGWAARVLSKAGASAYEIADLLFITRSSVLNFHNKNDEDKGYDDRQMSLF